MPANLAHFAINADDVPGARAFYERVFGWVFTPWGPPGFFDIRTGTTDSPGIQGALQQRRDLVDGQRTLAPECTFAVDDVETTRAAVLKAGGRIVMDRFTISGIGHLIYFQDPAGNLIGAMQYDDTAE